jgi:hypothetical protein
MGISGSAVIRIMAVALLAAFLMSCGEDKTEESAQEPQLGSWASREDRVPPDTAIDWEVVVAAPLTSAPFAATLSEGQAMRTSIMKGRNISVAVEGLAAGTSQVWVGPVLQGKPAAGWKMLSLGRGGQQIATFEQTAVEANAVLLWIEAGEVRAEVDTQKVSECYLLSKGRRSSSSCIVPIDPGQIVRVRVANAGEDGAVAVVSFLMDGQVVPDKVAGPEETRKLTVAGKGDFLTKTWAVQADETRIEAVEGEMVVRVAR